VAAFLKINTNIGAAAFLEISTSRGVAALIPMWFPYLESDGINDRINFKRMTYFWLNFHI
jgi:hypothetical protein